MNTVLSTAGKDNTRFTIFENDQVLTADQLNDLFNYLDVQTRLTRTKAIGIGIICGLEMGLLENNQVVVSKGSALTTDGDLLHFDTDQFFDQYLLFEDVNAKYPLFRMNSETVIPMYELLKSDTSRTEASGLEGFERVTNSGLKDYAGVLYLEEYLNDPDLCTGTDCDNKGQEAIRQLKVLIVHKDNLRLLLQSIPPINQNYFSLDDIFMPRVMINKSVDKYSELNTAFNNVLAIKKEIQDRFTKAFQVCRLIIDEEFDGGDPTTEWNNLMEEQFKTGSSIYAQYVYDYARDLCYAYNEMRETLFADNMMCCPDVQLFPKHILLGLVKTASIGRILSTDIINTDIRGNVSTSGGTVASPLDRTNIVNLLRNIRFDITSLIRRFHPVHIDITYRHFFYESPILNNKEENVQKARFCFRRIDALIRNFKVPTAEEFQNGAGSIRITPSHFEDKPLGDRSIPFYYRFNSNLPVNLYWSYSANVRKKEDGLYSYNANQYSKNAAALSPLQFNILPYDFFRIEGHIGFKYQEVERVLNQLIDSNNLPINIVTLQVEKNRETIRTLPWYFPHLHVYENSIRNTLFDHLGQVELYHNTLKDQVKNEPLNSTRNITTSMDSYSNARAKIFAHKPISHPEFDAVAFKADVGKAINAVSDVKFHTKDFSFSHASAPHDFVMNTDIIHKLDLYKDFVKQHYDQKKDGLMLGNFMKLNPGLEHAGGVLRGGTFILVYTGSDDKVVADFMIPYASIDKDLVPNPPIAVPIPEPVIPKIDLTRVFEKVPPYRRYVEEKFLPLDVRFHGIEEKFKPFDDKISFYDKTFTDRIKIIDDKIGSIDKTANDKFALVDKNLLERTQALDIKMNGFDRVMEDKFKGIDKSVDEKISRYDSTLKDKLLFSKGATTQTTTGPTRGANVVGERDLTREVEALQTKQFEVNATPEGSPARVVKEQELIVAADNLTTAVQEATATTTDVESANTAKALLLDVHTSTAPLALDQAHTVAVTNINTKVVGINKNIGTRFIR